MVGMKEADVADFAIGREDIKDFLASEISESFDVDWGAADGAEAILSKLESDPEARQDFKDWLESLD